MRLKTTWRLVPRQQNIHHVGGNIPEYRNQWIISFMIVCF